MYLLPPYWVNEDEYI